MFWYEKDDSKVLEKFYMLHFKCEGNTGEALEQEEELYGEVETVREFTYLGVRVSVVGDVRLQ